MNRAYRIAVGANFSTSPYHRRSNRGGAIALSAALAFALVVLGVGFLFLTMLMGAQNEVRNAVDSGCLNLGKQSLDQISVSAGLDPTSFVQGITSDSTDNSDKLDGKVTLRRINRLWGEALLIGINAEAAANDGNAGSGKSNAEQALNDASSISDALASKLKKPSNLYDFFNDFASRNSVRMLGLGVDTKVDQSAIWTTSLVNREDEGNLVLNGSPPNFNLPPNYNLDSSAFTKTTRTPVPGGAENLYFLKGYKSISASGLNFWQVPFLYDEKPHLISRSTFDSNSADQKALSWSNPVPNSFAASGMATKSNTMEDKASSFVLTNPNQPFQLSLPHSFVKIHVDDLKSHWWFFPTAFPPIEMDPTEDYDFIPDDQTNIPAALGGVLCSTVTPDNVMMGLDVVGEPLDGILFGYPFGDKSTIESYMVNRCNEMVGKVGVTKTASDLHSALANPSTIAALIAGIRDFYLFSPDGESLIVLPQALAVARSPWLLPLISATPDGDEKQLTSTTDPAPFFFEPVVTPLPFCTPFLMVGFGFYGKEVGWTPGTGYNGCLGTMRIRRWTDVYSLGACNPL